jgi:uncharacterized damage-inducible protein DinB
MNPYLMISIEHGPLIVRRLVEQIDPQKWDVPTYEDRFTTREVVAHLADWEPIMLARMQAAALAPGSAIAAYDETEMAQANDYASSNPLEQAERFIEGRSVSAQWLRGCRPEEWKQTVTHPERGTLSLEDLANLLLGHDLYHIEQLSAMLAPNR